MTSANPPHRNYMYYCQTCDPPVAMEPDPARPAARCPRCGRSGDGPARAPLFVITGASGAGKTAIAVPLAGALARTCVTFDADLLLDAAGELSGDHEINWPAFRAAWLAVAHGAAQSGLPTALLGPFIPAHIEPLPARRWISAIHYLVLDCPDALRRERIAARPSWRMDDVDEQVEFGRWLRANISDRVDTSRGTPAEAAAAVADWVRARLS